MRYTKLFLIFVFFIINFNLIIANIQLGNLSNSIQDSYTKEELIKGWVNFSLDKEPETSLIEAFEQNMSIGNFIKENGIDCIYSQKCSCFPLDCASKYSTDGSEMYQVQSSLKVFDSKLIGLRLTGNISHITSFGFNIQTNANDSCFFPLVIDLFDDEEPEFVSSEYSDLTCNIENPFGCFKQVNIIGTSNIGQTPLCQRISIPAARGFLIGARVIGNSSATLQMALKYGGETKYCNLNVTSEGEYSCIINLPDFLEESEIDICISASDNSIDKYRINYEDNQTCGYTDDSQGNFFQHDFEIFAKPLRYHTNKTIEFNQKLFGDYEINLTEEILSYIEEKYDSQCSPECIIPIRITSGINQAIKISNFSLTYKSEGLNKNPINKFYSINNSPVIISSKFMKLDIEKSKIKAPTQKGNYSLNLKIGDKRIEKNILVKDITQIKGIFPTNPVLLVEYDFFVALDSIKKNETYTYKWDFGDGTPIQTSTNNTYKHKYNEKKSYNLTISVSNNQGESNKTFIITVSSPFNAINQTITEYKKSLTSAKTDLESFPEYAKKEIIKLIDIDSLIAAVNKLDEKYKETLQSDEDEFVKIMNDLSKIKVPDKILTTEEVNSLNFVQNKDRLNTEILAGLDAGEVMEDKKEEYYGAINSWLFNNIDIKYESKTIAFSFYESEELIGTEVKIKLTPKKDIDSLFMVIEGNPSKISFKSDYNQNEIENTGYSILFSDLKAQESKDIELFYPEAIKFTDIPIYFSPEFSKLEFSPVIGVCNNNGKCETDIGEDKTNCKNDCKSWKWTIILLTILFLITFIVYIILQEWYKRYYERYLFKDKNQLFNLMAFMKNAENQKMNKKNIFDRLYPYKWNSEQLAYAWNKIHGKRTGMWEIPVFRTFENKKIKIELEKRKNIGFGFKAVNP